MQFEDTQQHTLANLQRAEQEVQAEKLSMRRALVLANALLSHGHPKAARAINLLKQKAQDEEFRTLAELYERNFLSLREHFRFEELTPEQLEMFYKISGLLYLRRKERSSRLLVIFTTMFNNFYYSNAALAGLLSRFDCDLLFLRDSTYFCYHKGAEGIADDFPGIGDRILAIARRNAIERIYLTGFSSSGYAALQTALLIPCHGYLGFSVQVDLREQALRLRSQYPELVEQADFRWVRDLTPLLESADPAVPRAIYYGERSGVDSDHARSVKGMRTIRTIGLPGVGHNIVRAFYLDRLLEVFATLVEGRSDWPTPKASDPVAAEVEISQDS